MLVSRWGGGFCGVAVRFEEGCDGFGGSEVRIDGDLVWLCVIGECVGVVGSVSAGC